MIDIRSDTVTMPTDEMRKAMATAELGDDVYGDDPTINRLQKMAADITGKEAALFVPTGTMANQLAIMSHTKRGDDVICLRKSHIYEHECGAASILSGVTLNLVDSQDGILHGYHLHNQVRPDDVHCPPTTLVCTENALALGQAVSLKDMKDLFSVAKSYGLNVHMDGARLFNAAIALGTTSKEIVQYTDSVMFCLSKGLCAPVGSMLCGTKDFISKAIRGRKILGGGMRQAGVLAAAGIVALEKMIYRLQEDHDHAALLAKRIAEIPGVKVVNNGIQINMVFFTLDRTNDVIRMLPEKMREKSIQINPISDGSFRFVTHYGIHSTDIEYIASTLKSILS
ncbi:MAG: low-specificity L-threonine aldolase [Clostridia bacterium]